jgi:hypothetical protein
MLFLDSHANRKRAPSAVPLAVHLVGRPLSQDEPIQRESLLSLEKLAAEGAPSETKTILGWLIDTRRLLISLPDDKWRAWTNDINDALDKSKHFSRKSLEQLIGRLNHVSHLIPSTRFFMGRLRSKLVQSKHKRRNIAFNKMDADNLHLWKTFLTIARHGINMNLLTLRRPTNIILTDACPNGLGGYSISSGRAWRIDLNDQKILDNNKFRGRSPSFP